MPAVNDVPTASTSAAATPVQVAAPVPSKAAVPQSSAEDNHVKHVEVAPPVPVAEPESVLVQQPEVNSNHVEKVEPENSNVVDAEEHVENGSSSKSGSQVKLKYEYKDSTYSESHFQSYL